MKITTKSILSACIIIGLALVCVKTYQQSSQISQLENALQKQSKKVIALNPKSLISQFMDEGYSQAESLEAFGIMIKMMEDEGVLVIDSKQAITAPTNKQLKGLKVDDIHAMAKARGVDVEAFKKDVIEQAKIEAERMIKELQSLNK